jgi:NitT/TauT family transport system ATP-binding protein
MAEYSIELDKVCMNFTDATGAERTVLDNFSLNIKQGEFVSLLGPSGCGKTTLLRIIADLQQQTSGSVTVDGTDARQARLAHKYGMVFQSPALLDWRTVIENVELPLELQKIPKRERRERALQQLKTVDLEGYEKSYPRELSGGMQQRVGIARALAAEPDILLMDEPFSALDEFTKERLHGDLLRIWRKTGKTIVFVTHNISEAVFLSDRVCVLSAHPARLAAVVDIPLPRPREDAVLKTEEYFKTVAHIREIFEEKYYENI